MSLQKELLPMLSSYVYLSQKVHLNLAEQMTLTQLFDGDTPTAFTAQVGKNDGIVLWINLLN